jgi:hypothetical protein
LVALVRLKSPPLESTEVALIEMRPYT